MSILCLIMHALCVYAVTLLSGFFQKTIFLFLLKTVSQLWFLVQRQKRFRESSLGQVM